MALVNERIEMHVKKATLITLTAGRVLTKVQVAAKPITIAIVLGKKQTPFFVCTNPSLKCEYYIRVHVSVSLSF